MFLRNLKALRDLKTMPVNVNIAQAGQVNIAQAGQVNVAQQQVNLADTGGD